VLNIEDLNPEYITNDKGEKKSVIIAISDFQALIEDIEYLTVIAVRRDEETVSHKDLLDELKKDGFI